MVVHSFISPKFIILFDPSGPNLSCRSSHLRLTAVSGRQRKLCLIRGSSLSSMASAMLLTQSALYIVIAKCGRKAYNPPITGIWQKPWPEAPHPSTRLGKSGCFEIKNARFGVSAHQQMRAKLKGLSARCGMISRRKPRALSSASFGI